MVISLLLLEILYIIYVCIYKDAENGLQGNTIQAVKEK